MKPGVEMILAVGSVPQFRDPILPGIACRLENVTGDNVKIADADEYNIHTFATDKIRQATIIAPGIFHGQCPGQSAIHTLEAVAPAKLIGEVMVNGAGGDIGPGKPVRLKLSADNGNIAGVTAQVFDRCGTMLDLGYDQEFDWSFVDCHGVVSMVEAIEAHGIGSPQIPITGEGAGTCKVKVEKFGLVAEIPIVVTK
jgi:hypothetical protein